MANSNGYRGMLRDRMPKTWSLALKYCKAKDRWIDYIYETWLKKLPKHKRGNMIKLLYGIKQVYIPLSEFKCIAATYNVPKNRIPSQSIRYRMEFHNTIAWEVLNEQEVTYWKSIESWVKWFVVSYAYIENHYSISLELGRAESEIEASLMNKFGIDKQLTKYLIKSFTRYE